MILLGGSGCGHLSYLHEVLMLHVHFKVEIAVILNMLCPFTITLLSSNIYSS